MPTRIVPARLSWSSEHVPRSDDYDDVYHTTEGGLEQARQVFLAGNALPERWRQRSNFTILETGFGLGLSFLASWQAWRDDPQRSTHLHFISTELHPFTRNDLAQLHAQWPELSELSAELRHHWPPLTPGFHHLLLDGGRVTLTLLFGDARETLLQLRGKADAIFLDGFAPQKNPALWSSEFLALLSQHVAPGATLASWCVAGDVRTALKNAGWTLQKKAGFARKRHMLVGAHGADAAIAPAEENSAVIIGAGIAGCSMAEALARRGWQITLLEKNAGVAQEASGNPSGLLHPMLAKDDNLAARFSRAAYLYTLRLRNRLGVQGASSGILEIAADSADEAAQQLLVQTYPEDYVQWLNRAEASTLAGQALAHGALHFPHGTWVSPPDFCRSLLEASGIAPHCNSAVATLQHDGTHWHALDVKGQPIASATHVILANAAAAQTLLPQVELALRQIRGQLSYLPSDSLGALDDLRMSLCGVGYVIRMPEQTVIGASFVEQDIDASMNATECPAEHAENLDKLHAMLPTLKLATTPDQMTGRVAFRTASRDRLPLVGTLPQVQLKEQHTLANLPRQAGLHALLGFGSRGLTWAPLAAETLAAQLNGEALPIETDLVRALDPARHHLRLVRREANRQ
ncbi:MAG TPA: bifunctional tRNA (5-methylaminomethyl-2-thiouridine)(34)-methyltransferase MnmD/FAD-dependent 5-carboxymethylaminomethyl-2-thiouridine(34) oxidoreductase MnmC [Rhodocyclaceae bacterium]|nr:bifunctional tRNA (5-methylaminomethyl-2-thiouridine)(34)-methyltransferase MnmD/FAD-dependent 5-carboxymethylaminomethyl-2-thiouridine(34) oxidoreductase MnmC [Rhodocyclaceae bacterium]